SSYPEDLFASKSTDESWRIYDPITNNNDKTSTCIKSITKSSPTPPPPFSTPKLFESNFVGSASSSIASRLGDTLTPVSNNNKPLINSADATAAAAATATINTSTATAK